MIAALWTTVAFAEPVALRGLRDEATAVVGFQDISGAAPVGPVRLAVSTRWDRGAVDVALGKRWQLRRGERGWQIDAGLAGGLIVPLVEPTVGLTFTPFVTAGPVGRRWAASGVIAMPMALSPRGGLRVPLLFEIQAGYTGGRVTVGPRLSVGPVWAPGTDVSVATEGGLQISVRPGRRP